MHLSALSVPVRWDLCQLGRALTATALHYLPPHRDSKFFIAAPPPVFATQHGSSASRAPGAQEKKRDDVVVQLYFPSGSVTTINFSTTTWDAIVLLADLSTSEPKFQCVLPADNTYAGTSGTRLLARLLSTDAHKKAVDISKAVQVELASAERSDSGEEDDVASAELSDSEEDSEDDVPPKHMLGIYFEYPQTFILCSTQW